MVTNAPQTKQNQRKIEKISKYAIETPTAEKLPRKIETRVSNSNLTVINASWTTQNQRREKKLSKYKEERNNNYRANIMKEHKRKREEEEKMNAQI